MHIISYSYLYQAKTLSSWCHCVSSSSARYKSSNMVSTSSSVSSVLTHERLTICVCHVAFNIWSVSNTSALSLVCWSVAVSFLLEKTCSHGTDDAWLGRTSRAMQASVGYIFAWFCNYFVITMIKKMVSCTYWPPGNDICVSCHIWWHILEILP